MSDEEVVAAEFVLEPMTEEEIEDVARRVVTGQTYVAFHPDQQEDSFGMFVMLMVGGGRTQGHSLEWMKDVRAIYEDMSKAMTMGVNGAPQFMSAKFVHKDSAADLQRRCIEKLVAIGVAKQEELDQFDADRAEHEAEADMESKRDQMDSLAHQLRPIDPAIE